MVFEVDYAGFKTQRLSVEAAGMFSGPKLLLNGAEGGQEKGRHLWRALARHRPGRSEHPEINRASLG